MVQTWKPNRTTASIFLFACATGLLAAGIVSITGGKVSTLRLGLLGVSVLFSAGLCLLAIWNLRSPRISNWWQRFTAGYKLNALTIATVIVFLGAWVTIWTPLEHFGSAYYYVQGVYPFIAWLTCASAAGVILLVIIKNGLVLEKIKEYLQNQRIVFVISAVLLVLFGLLAWLASIRVVGMQPAEEDFWYGAGVPVLAFQVQLALFLGFALTFLIDKWIARTSIPPRQIDIVLFILIWAVAAWMWAREPARPDFLVTAPVAPNFEMYPDYDARNYDIMSQFALIGQGLNNHEFFDRMLYPALLVYLHNLGGQDYQGIMALQAALFAVLPALIFLIGKKLHSRSAGLVLGILMALRGINQIQVGNIIETAHQKYMLTEYPMTVMLVLATVLLVRWAWNPSKNWALAGFAGCVIGLSTLLRPHSLALIPTVIVLTILVYRQKARLWLGVSGLMFAAALVGILPWVQFSGNKTNLFDLYLVRISYTIQERYPQFFQQPGREQPEPTATAPKGNLHPAPVSSLPTPEKSVLAFATDNFLNNLVTSVQVLPNTPFYLEPRVVVKKTDNFWKPYWDGSTTPWARLLIPINLLFIALGIGAAWKRARLSGLIPLVVMLVYNAVNALGRTSGGRYIVPVDWAIVIYYVLGLVVLIEAVSAFWGRFRPQPETQERTNGKKYSWWIGTLAVLLTSMTFGAFLPLAQVVNPSRYPVRPDTELADQFISLGGKQLGITAQDIQKFLSAPDAVILQGRALYPRQFDKDEGLDISIYDFYHPMPYPRTLFTLIGPKGASVIILPRTKPAIIPNDVDVIALGCKVGIFNGYVQTWAVIRTDTQGVFERIPSGTPLTCPLPEPVCDNNNYCR